MRAERKLQIQLGDYSTRDYQDQIESLRVRKGSLLPLYFSQHSPYLDYRCLGVSGMVNANQSSGSKLLPDLERLRIEFDLGNYKADQPLSEVKNCPLIRGGFFGNAPHV